MPVSVAAQHLLPANLVVQVEYNIIGPVCVRVDVGHFFEAQSSHIFCTQPTSVLLLPDPTQPIVDTRQLKKLFNNRYMSNENWIFT